MVMHIKECRRAAGLKQSEVAERLGIKTRTYGSWERGEAMPSASQLWDVCVALGTDPNTILGWWDDHERPETSYEDDRQRAMNVAWEGMTEKGKTDTSELVVRLSRTDEYIPAGSLAKGAATAGNLA